MVNSQQVVKVVGGEEVMRKVMKVLRVKTGAIAQIVIRNGAGEKLFDIDLAGVSIKISVLLDEEIEIEPRSNGLWRAR